MRVHDQGFRAPLVFFLGGGTSFRKPASTRGFEVKEFRFFSGKLNESAQGFLRFGGRSGMYAFWGGWALGVEG